MAFAICLILSILFVCASTAYSSVIPFYSSVVTKADGKYRAFTNAIKRSTFVGTSTGPPMNTHTASALATSLIIVALAVGLVYAFFRYRSWSHQRPQVGGTYRLPPPPLRGRPTAGAMIFSRSTFETLPRDGDYYTIPNTHAVPAVPHYIGNVRSMTPLTPPTPTYSPGGRFDYPTSGGVPRA